MREGDGGFVLDSRQGEELNEPVFAQAKEVVNALLGRESQKHTKQKQSVLGIRGPLVACNKKAVSSKRGSGIFF